ncbi:ribosomal RNA small subunit methyltransferase, mitochondrial-like [Dioscorea cayenensis subsp. rotundata]|uniref:rRNA adenine N(6)-methyltransferase n=1 Tax=Dioscorea cayennensis subsp. rotundata TaxID=55577 RepID=A0AB40BEV8_DIOCR|nr:ribosomal RNA small subunit methyltransferase, mitochondrial-like [Dioscorea cayenensis subsp. rotundata]
MFQFIPIMNRVFHHHILRSLVAFFPHIRFQSHGLLSKAFSRIPTRHQPHRHHNYNDNDNGNGDPKNQKPWNEAFGSRFQLHKSRGQHLLTNPRILDSIVRRANIYPDDTVLEIGPGTGNLTVRLLQYASKVIAVEIDHRMVDSLLGRVSQLGLADRLTVIKENALMTKLPPFDLCVANIPYGISSPLIAKLLFETRPPCFRTATLLLQKEFARRLLAMPGDSDYNRLAVNVGLVANVEFLMDVSKKDFVPSPKVDSTLVKIRPRDEVPVVDLDEWQAFIRTCFSKRNKTLGAIFKQKKKIAELLERLKKKKEKEEEEEDDDDDDCENGEAEVGGDGLEVGLFKERVIGILKSGGLEEKRPSKLSNEELLHLLQLFNKEGIVFH